MTEEQIKEQLSRHYVELVASRSGYVCMGPQPDHGVDLVVSRVEAYRRNGKTRFFPAGQYLDLQLKCTCEASVISTPTGLKYDLEAKTYNDLVDRWASESPSPLYLVLLVLPDDATDWLHVSGAELILRRSAFWYRTPAGATATNNSSSKRIEIPARNLVTLDFFRDRMAEFYV